MRVQKGFVIPLALSAALSVQACDSTGSVEPTGSDGPTTAPLVVEPTTTLPSTITTLPPTTTTLAPTTTTITTTNPEVDDPAARIQRGLNDAAEGWPAPGLMLWVDTPEQVIIATSGWADREEQIPIQPDRPFYSGSITKMIVTRHQ